MIHQKKRKKRKQLDVRKGVISLFYSYVPWRQGKLDRKPPIHQSERQTRLISPIWISLKVPDNPSATTAGCGKLTYTRLILFGKLYEHLAETDQVCRDRMKRMIAQMAEAEGINEKLKASDQLGWISRMSSIRHRVEEIVLDELVFS